MSGKMSLTGTALIWVIFLIWAAFPAHAQNSKTITDSMNRELTIPAQVDRVICSNSGCLRLLTYLQAHDRIVAVDSIEVKGSPIDARPYAIANPQFRDYPIFGEFRGHDSPELIAGLDPQPRVMFKTYAARSGGIDTLQDKINIPVIGLGYGNLTHGREELNENLRLMGKVLKVEDRAEEVIAFFNDLQKDLEQRVADIPEDQRPSCYIGGLGQRGPHGFQSTEPSYAPFEFLGAKNVAGILSTPEKRISHANVSKEQILIWDPEIIFVDISTMRMDQKANAISQLKNDPAYQSLGAVRNGQIYGVFPYNSYTQNFESIFANAYFMGKILYPEQFADIDPMQKAEEIANFLNGGPAFKKLNTQFDGLGFSRINVN
ncbi:MAG: iron ABC transporter substrate-binding protein [Desulfonatronovibrio sp.]